MKSKKEGDPVHGKVTKKIKGGLLVDIGVPVFLPASQVDIRRPQSIDEYIDRTIECVILKIDEVWETKYKAFQILAAQKHLWHYYERVALNRGIQGSRNTGVPMTYGEAYQTLFPRVTMELG